MDTFTIYKNQFHLDDSKNPITKKNIKYLGETYMQLVNGTYDKKYGPFGMPNKQPQIEKVKNTTPNFNSDIYLNLILNVDDTQSLIDLYNTSKQFKRLLDRNDILSMLKLKFELTYPINTFNELIIELRVKVNHVYLILC